MLGSVANLIVAERARQHHELGFMEYPRFGVSSTLAASDLTMLEPTDFEVVQTDEPSPLHYDCTHTPITN